jgi:hypothetical protein
VIYHRMILDGSSSFISNMIEKERIVSKSSRTVENGACFVIGIHPKPSTNQNVTWVRYRYLQSYPQTL